MITLASENEILHSARHKLSLLQSGGKNIYLGTYMDVSVLHLGFTWFSPLKFDLIYVEDKRLKSEEK